MQKLISLILAAMLAFITDSYIGLIKPKTAEAPVLNGQTKYFTLSFDDGITQDKKIIEICNKYNFRGITFNLNSGLCGENWEWVGDAIGVPGTTHQRFTEKEIKSGIYKGFDIAVHTKTHPSLKDSDKRPIKFWYEVQTDAFKLCSLTGIMPIGMAYPGGDGAYTEKTAENIRKYTSIKYARGTGSTYGFEFPDDYLVWQPTCSILDDKVFELARKFIERNEPGIFYVWGHGYELDAFNKYDSLEKLIKMMTESSDIACLSNTEIYLLNNK